MIPTMAPRRTILRFYLTSAQIPATIWVSVTPGKSVSFISRISSTFTFLKLSGQTQLKGIPTACEARPSKHIIHSRPKFHQKALSISSKGATMLDFLYYLYFFSDSIPNLTHWYHPKSIFCPWLRIFWKFTSLKPAVRRAPPRPILT